MDDKKEIERLRQQVEARKQKEADQFDGGSGNGGGFRDDGNPKITSKFIIECLYSNALGDGILYAEIHKYKFLFHNLADRWLAWGGHHWEWDIDLQALKAVERVAEVYIKEARSLVDKIDWALKKSDNAQASNLQKVQNDIYRRVGRLRSETGRQSCLKFARSNSVSSLDVRGDRFDANPWVFAFKNGVVDLRTGELRPGRQDDFILRASAIEFAGIDAPAPRWEKFILEIFSRDRDIVKYIQRLLGYGMTGLTVEHILPIFFGPAGRNGKGVLCRLIMRTLGDCACPIKSEILLDSGRVRSSASPDPDILDLKGLRLAFASETDEFNRFSPAMCKRLSGGDELKGRYPFERDIISFHPTHLLILTTNEKPHAPAHDSAFWERVHLIPFKLSYVRRAVQAGFERPADIHLEEKLKDELGGIAAWLVRGCIEWQRIGLEPPQIIKDSTAEYRADEDDLSTFIDDECIVQKNLECKSAELYDRFRPWWEENIGKKAVPSNKRFAKLMVRKFERVKRSVGWVFVGLDLIRKIDDGEMNFPGHQGD